jgi:hypothetical protein
MRLVTGWDCTTPSREDADLETALPTHVST